jgi:hypothetical protein
MKKFFCLVLGLFFACHAMTDAAILPLDGVWQCELDRQDAGKTGDWFNRPLTGRTQLPGSLSENGLGDPMTVVRQNTWGDKWTGKPVWHPMLRRDYRGAAWYEKTVTLPEAWKGKFVSLFLERVCWQSELWVDGKPLGRRDSLSSPHEYDLDILPPGTHTLALRIDNRKLLDLGCNTHAFHEPSCTIYNGVIGRVELRAEPVVSARADQVFADPATGLCELRLTLANRTGKSAECVLSAEIRRDGRAETLASAKQTLTLPPGKTEVKLPVQVPKGSVQAWGEFDRPLYVAQVETKTDAGDISTRSDRFGFRTYEAKDGGYLINGKPILLRGEANNAQFPLTGYPPMDKAAWLKIFQLFKDFGLNHVRFHSWVPPEAAFNAADELGLYLQPELPNGEDSVADPAGHPWRQAEFDRILATYGNHPSFVQMTMGNEAKTRKIEFLKELVKRGRAADNRHLYASISNPEASSIEDEVPGDDFAVAHGSAHGRRRMESAFNNEMPETFRDYRATTQNNPVPQISHETGQWYVYPDLGEIAKYTGLLRPVTLEYFRDMAEKEGVLAQVPSFMDASGRLSLLLYKEEVERSLRTPKYGGFQLLGVQDSFDQGAAYVGCINSFFEPKPYVTAAAFHEFCGAQVPLARMAKRVWKNDETFAADLSLANYGPSTLVGRTVAWKLSDGERTVAEGDFGPMDLPNTGLCEIGSVKVPLVGITRATQLELCVSVPGTEIRNRWNAWVYPAACDTAAPLGVKVVSSIDAATLAALREGARVVLLPKFFTIHYPTAMTPPFWSPIMFGNQSQTLGILCVPKHPALSEFPTSSHQDWQWFELVTHGTAVRLIGTPPNVHPIVQAIDRPDRNHKLALVYETKVGNGSLLVSTLDLQNDLDKRPVARQLRRSLLDYAAGPDFHPTVELDLAQNLPDLGATTPKVLSQLSPKVTADSEHENNWANFAVDGNPKTLWHTRWDATSTPLPHSLTIELKEPIAIEGFIQMPRQDNNHGRIVKYRIHTSQDGKAWTTVAEGNWPDSADTQRVLLKMPVRARFIRLEALKSADGSDWTSVAEFDVIAP